MTEHVAGAARRWPATSSVPNGHGVVARSGVPGATKGFTPSRSRLRGERGAPSKTLRGALMVCRGEPRELRPAQSRATDDSPTECP